MKTYKIDKFTNIKKLSNGVEYVEEDYSSEMPDRIAMPQKVKRLLHPGGRQDCKIEMGGAARTRSKSKI